MHETTRLLRDLVALPSVNPMGRPLEGPTVYEHRVTAYLQDFFQGLGVPFERQTVAPLRDNIVARLEPPAARGTLVLEVHQDTVPTDGMTIDPFAARIENGRLYGRGACDVKGGMAAMLAAFAPTNCGRRAAIRASVRRPSASAASKAAPASTPCPTFAAWRSTAGCCPARTPWRPRSSWWPI
jgi:hypothetical protein